MRLSLAPLVVLSLLACSNAPQGPREVRFLGTVAFGDEGARIVVPDTVSASVPFIVRVLTEGGGCERQGPTEVEIGEGQVVVSPYDFRVTRPGVGCVDIGHSFEHEVELTWPTPGEVSIIVRGIVLPDSVEAEFERKVVVVESPLSPPGIDLPYVVDPACPGEGCTYEKWLVCDSIPLWPQPAESGEPVGWLERETRFDIERGLAIVHQPAVYVVERQIDRDSARWESLLPMEAGDTLYVLEYIGEGFYHVWWDGTVQESYQFWRGGQSDTVHPSLRQIQNDSSEFWALVSSEGGREAWLRVWQPEVYRGHLYDMSYEVGCSPSGG